MLKTIQQTVRVQTQTHLSSCSTRPNAKLASILSLKRLQITKNKIRIIILNAMIRIENETKRNEK